MTKHWSIAFLGCSLLLAPSAGTLLAQKGQGGTTGSTKTRPSALPPSHAADAKGSTAGVADNKELSARVRALLPSGWTIATASAGFRNQGSFLAALHVSRNLKIPFDQLKAKLTGNKTESLGSAIHDLRPNLAKGTVKHDVRLAEHQADQDIGSARLANQLSTNPALASRARMLLPAGMNVQTAAAGFENDRQFFEAEHLAHDLNIPFAGFKAKVTGTDPMSFKEALAALKPGLQSSSVKSHLKLARQEASADLEAAKQSAEDHTKIAQKN